MTDAEIKVSKPMPGVKSVPFVYVRTVAPANAAALEPFLRDSLTKIGFPRQVNEEELTKLVIQSGLSSGIQNLSSVIALHRLSEIIGPFLVVEVRAARITDVWYRLDAVIVDPVVGETVFAVSRTKINWIDFDREFSYPMMNAIKSWYDASAALPSVPAATKANPGAI
jgi:hypothetical protein